MNSLLESSVKIFSRDLDKMAAELKMYPDDASIWVIRDDIKNPAGNLCLHLCGNLQQYIGLGFGNIPYTRNRDYEFSARGLSRDHLLAEIEKAKHSVIRALSDFSPEKLDTDFPQPVFDYAMSHTHFLVHLIAHFGYHLGQINYHRRLVVIGQ